VAALLFAHDGAELIVGFAVSANVLVLNAGTGKLLRMIERTHGRGRAKSSEAALRSFALTPDGAHLITFGQRTERHEDLPPGFTQRGEVTLAEVCAWEMASGAVVRNLMNDRLVEGLGYGALSPDGSLITCGCDERVELIDARTGAVTRTLAVPGLYFKQPAFSPDGSKLAVGLDNVISLWDVATGERLLADQPGHEDQIGDADWSADGRFLATTGHDGAIHVWEAETGRHAWGDTLGHDSICYPAAFSRDGGMLAASGNGLGRARVWSAEGMLRGEIQIEPGTYELALSPDGTRIVVVHNDPGGIFAQLELWQVDPPEKLGEFPRDNNQRLYSLATMDFSSNGRFVRMVDHDGNVTWWDTSPAAEDRSFVLNWRAPDQRPQLFQLSIGDARIQPGAELLVGSTHGAISLWDISAGTLTETLIVPGVPHEFTIGLSSDGKTLAASEIASVNDPGTDVIRIFDLPTRKLVLTVSPDDARATSFAFSPHGRRLLSGFDNGTAIVWDVAR
jgi:WD40 repeat protein